MSDCHDCRQAPDSTPAPSELSFGRTKLPTDHRLVSQAQLPGHADNHRTLHFRHIASPGQRDISGEFPSSVTHQEAEPGSSFLNFCFTTPSAPSPAGGNPLRPSRKARGCVSTEAPPVFCRLPHVALCGWELAHEHPEHSGHLTASETLRASEHLTEHLKHSGHLTEHPQSPRSPQSISNSQLTSRSIPDPLRSPHRAFPTLRSSQSIPCSQHTSWSLTMGSWTAQGKGHPFSSHHLLP